MSILYAILMIPLIPLILFANIFYPEDKCPRLRSETRPIYEETKNISYADGKVIYEKIINMNFGDVKVGTTTIEIGSATTTIINGKAYTQIGTEHDLEAIEYNKKVKECQIANGEF